MAHVLSVNTEEWGFMTFIAANHQGDIQMISSLESSHLYIQYRVCTYDEGMPKPPVTSPAVEKWRVLEGWERDPQTGIAPVDTII